MLVGILKNACRYFETVGIMNVGIMNVGIMNATHHSLLISRESRGPASYSFTTLIKHVPDIQLIYSGFDECYF